MDTFTIKLIGLILMVIDHIGFYIPGMPVWLRWLGRGAYPLFLFAMVWGYHYTGNRKRYLLRLYGMGLFMGGLAYALIRWGRGGEDYGNHNIFVSLFLVGVLISTIEAFMEERKKGYLWLGGLMAVQLLYYLLPGLAPGLRTVSGDILTALLPNLALQEYGPLFLILGVSMYFLKEKPEAFTVVYLLFCLGQFSLEMLETGTCSQWFMLIALPFMLAYNREKGRGMKWFFYWFYPAHTLALFGLARYLKG